MINYWTHTNTVSKRELFVYVVKLNYYLTLAIGKTVLAIIHITNLTVLHASNTGKFSF